MGKVKFHTAVSLDGFVAGPNDSPENGLGEGGECLHTWYFNGTVEIPISDGQMVLKVSPQSAALIHEVTANNGAEIWGRRTFDITGGWGGHPPSTPCFIVTHEVPQAWAGEGSPFVFITDGVESAIRQAKAAAGEKDVMLNTASILQQGLNAGLVDEIAISIVPCLLGGGVRLFEQIDTSAFELETTRVVEAPGVTHLIYRIKKKSS